MPALIISTNVSLDGVDTSSILSEATSEVAKIIGKPANMRPGLISWWGPRKFGFFMVLQPLDEESTTLVVRLMCIGYGMCLLKYLMFVAMQYVMIVLKGSIPISFGGTQEPAAFGELVSIGGLNPDVNKNLSSAIASILEKTLSVPKSRFPLWMERYHLLNPASFFASLQLNVGDSIRYSHLVL
ncbi:hypothetical protein DKX38_009523 [Salix brachista]|uniref:Uncharacterized protein n=1 Tax=Salix brachista TaxID=2182728 RepID=A0A5N5MB72_9ROSI|nr:hypothetical protein DKX38_009523 [Salix brachista]